MTGEAGGGTFGVSGPEGGNGALQPIGTASSTPYFASKEGTERVEALRRAESGTPVSDLSSNNVGKTIVNACSRPRPLHKPGEARNIGPYAKPITPDDPICVNGQPYTDPYQVPGYQPTQVNDSQGHPVQDGAGGSLVGPSSGVSSMGNIANQMDQDVGNPIARYNDIKQFYPGGKWDYQRITDDDGSIVFLKKYTSFTNVLIGYADAKNSATQLPTSEFITSSGAAVEDAAHLGDVYKGRKKDPDYPFIPSENVKNIQIGRNLRFSEPGRGYSFDQWLQIQQMFPMSPPPGAGNIPFR